ncbi:MAG: hypothetical protein JEZ09_17760 [Salinivirgaceae bacterium]|nr:hypothetical protein [Salinivirgaceae bacterium]
MVKHKQLCVIVLLAISNLNSYSAYYWAQHMRAFNPKESVGNYLKTLKLLNRFINERVYFIDKPLVGYLNLEKMISTI